VNAPYAYGFPRRVAESSIESLWMRRPLRPPHETAESLRDAQHSDLAEQHIRRAGDYIKQGQNFEAIQCCNNALNLNAENTDALLGRAIA
jgi:Tfp pilus assembly protein PilF